MAESNGSDDEHMDISRAAVMHVLNHEVTEGRFPEEMDHFNPGYDIISKSSDGEILRYIEVKGIDGIWTEKGVPLSSTQFSFAQDNSKLFWLYVVENARNKNKKVWPIHNPTEKVTEFRFDRGWQQVSDEGISSTTIEPEVVMAG